MARLDHVIAWPKGALTAVTALSATHLHTQRPGIQVQDLGCLDPPHCCCCHWHF
jgi:hypothetical protein